MCRQGLSPKPITNETNRSVYVDDERESNPAIGWFFRCVGRDVVTRGTAVVTNMTGNPNFPNPPVDLAVVKADIGKLSGLRADALDGRKKIIAEKNKQRATVIKELSLRGRYVEVSCKNDIFKSSGFEPASEHRRFKRGTANMAAPFRGFRDVV